MPEKAPSLSLAALNAGVAFDFSAWTGIELRGPDARDFLNRLSTLNFKNWDASQTRLGAFLTGRSWVVALGFFQSEGAGFRLWVPAEQKVALEEHLEKLHFAEDLQRVDVSGDWALVGAYGFAPTGTARSWPDPLIAGLTWVCVPRGEATEMLQRWQSEGHPLAGEAEYEYLRLQAGLPRVGKEIGAETLLLEAGLEKAVDRNKGCYPGQEVIERIFTYGQVNRKLVRVNWTGTLDPAALPVSFERDGKPVAVLAGAVPEPGQANRGVGLARVHKNFWGPGESFKQPGLRLVVV